MALLELLCILPPGFFGHVTQVRLPLTSTVLDHALNSLGWSPTRPPQVAPVHLHHSSTQRLGLFNGCASLFTGPQQNPRSILKL